jgi:hypothetical protein
MGARSEADDEEAGERVAEAWDGTAPVILAAIGALLDSADFFAVEDQAGTLTTGDNFGVQYFQQDRVPPRL